MLASPNFQSIQLLIISLLCTFLLVACGGGGGGESKSDPAITLVSLSLSEIAQTLKIDESSQLTLTGSYSDSSEQVLSSDITWSVLNDTIVSVSDTGLVTALSAGSTNVIASFGGLSVERPVSVKALADLSISPTSLTLAINSSQQLSVTGRYTDNTTENVDELVTWESESSSIASVSDTGEVVAISAGTTEITASVDGLTSSPLSVTVSPATLQSIIVSSAVTQLASGLSLSASANGLYSDGTEQNLNGQVVWSVTDTDKASIDPESGLLTGLQAGTIDIVATQGSLTGSLEVTISPATLAGIAITPSVISLAKGVTAEVNVTAIFSDNTKQNVSDQVEWSNTNSEVASIDNGAFIITALDEGVATITANLSGQQADIRVSVTNAELVSLSLSPSNASIPLGLSQQYQAQGTYTDGSVQDLSAQVTWLSSHEEQVLISNNGSLKGLAESVSLGAATITAVLGDIEQQTTLTVEDAVLNSLEIQPSNQTVANGTDAQIKAFGYYSDGSIVDLTTIAVWNTTSPTMIDVLSAKNGIVHTLAQGSALISAELEGVSALAIISVSAATLESIQINATNASLPNGMRQGLSATGTYSDASTRDISQQVTWQSSDVQIATISNNASEAGLLRAVGVGQATLTATLGLISDEVTIEVSSAVLTGLAIQSAASELNVKTTTVVTATATYSDDSTQDVSAQVDWTSSDNTIASIGNSFIDKGQVSALSIGVVSITASLNGMTSASIALEVTLNPHLPKAIKISPQPNVILNNSTDSSQINIVLVPTDPSGVIADGTQIELTITEGGTSRVENLVSENGAVSYSLQSSYDGLISLSASAESLSVSSGILSTDSFTDAILSTGQASASFENNTLKAGSSFYLLLRNLSNRVFTIRQIDIVYLDPANSNAVVAFPESPLTDSQFMSGGELTAGEFTYIGYVLENDVEANIYVISYLFYDEVSDTQFRLEGGFNFSQ